MAVEVEVDAVVHVEGEVAALVLIDAHEYLLIAARVARVPVSARTTLLLAQIVLERIVDNQAIVVNGRHELHLQVGVHVVHLPLLGREHARLQAHQAVPHRTLHAEVVQIGHLVLVVWRRRGAARQLPRLLVATTVSRHLSDVAAYGERLVVVGRGRRVSSGASKRAPRATCVRVERLLLFVVVVEASDRLDEAMGDLESVLGLAVGELLVGGGALEDDAVDERALVGQEQVVEAHGAARLAEQTHLARRAAEVGEIAFAVPLDGEHLVGEAGIAGHQRVVQEHEAERTDAVVGRHDDDVLERGECGAVGDAQVGRAAVVRAAEYPEESGLALRVAQHPVAVDVGRSAGAAAGAAVVVAGVQAERVRHVLERVDRLVGDGGEEARVLLAAHRHPDVHVEAVLAHVVRRIPHLAAVEVGAERRVHLLPARGPRVGRVVRVLRAQRLVEPLRELEALLVDGRLRERQTEELVHVLVERRRQWWWWRWRWRR